MFPSETGAAQVIPLSSERCATRPTAPRDERRYARYIAVVPAVTPGPVAIQGLSPMPPVPPAR